MSLDSNPFLYLFDYFISFVFILSNFFLFIFSSSLPLIQIPNKMAKPPKIIMMNISVFPLTVRASVIQRYRSVITYTIGKHIPQ